MGFAGFSRELDGLIFAPTQPQVNHFNAGAAQQIHTVMHAVVLAKHHALDTRLDDELAALHAGRRGDVERGTLAAVVAARYLGDGVGLGMQHIGLSVVGILFTDVLKARRRAVIAIADDHFVLDEQGAHLTAAAIGIFGPDLRHAQVSGVKQQLFFLASVHSLLI